MGLLAGGLLGATAFPAALALGMGLAASFPAFAMGLLGAGLEPVPFAPAGLDALAGAGFAADEAPALPRAVVGLDDGAVVLRFALDFLSEVVFRTAAMGACHLDSLKSEQKGAGS
jgi:hypothetical protein